MNVIAHRTPGEGRKACLSLALFISLLLAFFLGAGASAATIHNVSKSYGPSNVVMKTKEIEGSWKQKDGKYYFYKTSGKLVKAKWFKNNGAIYLVTASGKRVSGWVKYRGDMYYLRRGNGQLVTGWLKSTYYFRPSNGRMVRNKLYDIDGNTYYFQNGKKQKGMQTIDGKQYYFSSSGKMAKSTFVKSGGYIYWMQATGVMAKSGWLTLGQKRYYINSEGHVVTGTQQIHGTWYTFDPNGVMISSTTIDPAKPMVALTFDDGPSIYTPRILSTLRAYNAHATFMMMGDRALTYASTVRQILAAGCELGNHSMTHAAMTTLSYAQIQAEFSQTSQNIYSAAGQYPTVGRLPYGDGYNNSSVLSAMGLPSIYWSLDTEDWNNKTNPQSTINAVLNTVKSGDIVLMHDLYEATATAVDTIVPALVERGFQLVTVSELARYRKNITLTTGVTYFNFY